MAKRQNFVVGSTNPNTEAQTVTELNNGWDRYAVLRSGKLDGVFNAVSDYSNDSSNEIANAIQSITGSQPTGNSQSELAGALSQLRSEIETKSLTFKGYVGTSAPDSNVYTIMEGNIWINSASMPTSFPVAASSIKEWSGTAWVNYGSAYTPADFDFFRNLTDNEGYYWFGGVWTIMSTDMSTTYFTLNQSTGKWEIKSSVNLPGSPTTTTPPVADDSTKIATTEWVNANSSRQDLFDIKWSDYELSDMAWLRADTFSWQPGTTYSNAYNHLVDDINGKTLQSETVAGTTIQFYLANDGHKICPASEESNVISIFTATGIAWYYILDTANTRFKLPRTQFAFVGVRSAIDSAGKYVAPGLPNITGQANVLTDNASGTGALSTTVTSTAGLGSSIYSVKGTIDLDASNSNSIYGNGTTVQQPATEMYLYFYVGQFTHTATQNTAGLNAELFNNKADRDLTNAVGVASQTAKDAIVSWGMPDYDSGITGISSPYTPTKDGYLNVVRTSGYGEVWIKYGGVLLAQIKCTDSDSSTQAIIVPVNAGEEYTFIGTGTFYPAKGV